MLLVSLHSRGEGFGDGGEARSELSRRTGSDPTLVTLGPGSPEARVRGLAHTGPRGTPLDAGTMIPVPTPALRPEASHLVSLVQRLLPVVQLLLQVALLPAEQLLKHKSTGVSARASRLAAACCRPRGRRPPTFSLSRSTILRCRADSVSSICCSHWTQKERGMVTLRCHTGTRAIPPPLLPETAWGRRRAAPPSPLFLWEGRGRVGWTGTTSSVCPAYKPGPGPIPPGGLSLTPSPGTGGR